MKMKVSADCNKIYREFKRTLNPDKKMAKAWEFVICLMMEAETSDDVIPKIFL